MHMDMSEVPPVFNFPYIMMTKAAIRAHSLSLSKDTFVSMAGKIWDNVLSCDLVKLEDELNHYMRDQIDKVENMDIWGVVYHCLGEDEKDRIDEFSEFAFGPNFQEISCSLAYLDSWNNCHAELKISQEEEILSSIKQMISHWKDVTRNE